MELLSAKPLPADVNGKDTQSMDNLRDNCSTPTKLTPRAWGSKRKKSTSLDTDVFIGNCAMYFTV